MKKDSKGNAPPTKTGTGAKVTPGNTTTGGKIPDAKHLPREFK
jgi:hypothetical protein